MEWIKKTNADMENDEANAIPEGEIVLLTVSTTWCGPCQEMKKSMKKNLPAMLSEQYGKEWAKKVNLVVFDGDDEANEDFMNMFEVDAFPTWFLFYKVNGEAQNYFKQEGWGDELYPELLENIGEIIELIKNGG